jgi:hypothetical protein
MRLFRKKSTWEKLTDPVVQRAQEKGTVRSSLLAAGAAGGVTAASSVVSSIRKKWQQ